jgi:hypothetical protein
VVVKSSDSKSVVYVIASSLAAAKSAAAASLSPSQHQICSVLISVAAEATTKTTAATADKQRYQDCCRDADNDAVVVM